MAMGSQKHDDDAEMSDINMTPLIDVMLVLLIIFIITLPVITHSVQIDLPKVSNQPTNEKPNVITLSVDKAGGIFWNDAAISKEELESKLKSSSAENPQPEIHIRGDKKTEYENMIVVMNAVQLSGLTKIGFITEPPSK
jgi:biopolymer transport protein ExbD